MPILLTLVLLAISLLVISLLLIDTAHRYKNTKLGGMFTFVLVCGMFPLIWIGGVLWQIVFK